MAPVVALVEHHDLGAMLRDAVFLPDMVPGRLEREMLHPLAGAGMPAMPVEVADALDPARGAVRIAGRGPSHPVRGQPVGDLPDTQAAGGMRRVAWARTARWPVGRGLE